MYATAFNIGIDRTVQLVDQTGRASSFDNTGSPGSLGRLISFESTATVDVVENPAISDGGDNDSMTEYKDWKGTIVIDRRNANADAFFAALEAAYHAGNQQLKFTIHETTVNRTGTQTSTSSFVYINASVWIEKTGTWALGTRPEITLMFHATRRVQAS